MSSGMGQGLKSGEGSFSPLQTLTYYRQTLLRYQAVDGILPGKSILLASIFVY